MAGLQSVGSRTGGKAQIPMHLHTHIYVCLLVSVMHVLIAKDQYLKIDHHLVSHLAVARRLSIMVEVGHCQLLKGLHGLCQINEGDERRHNA